METQKHGTNKRKYDRKTEKRINIQSIISIQDSQIATNILTPNQTVPRNKNCKYRTLGIKQDKQTSETKIKQQRTKHRESQK